MTERDAIDQLAALLDGEDVPGAPSSLGALADLATSVRDHAELVAPSADFREALRADLVAVAEAPPGLVDRARATWAARTAGLRASTRVAVATMTASSMLGTAGVAVAAQEALPGDLLYGIKGLTEDARLLLAPDALAEARLHLEFAQERMEELEAMAGQLDSDQVAALLAEMDFHSEAGAEALIEGVTSGAIDPDELRDFTARQRGRLTGVLDELPLLSRPLAEDSLELLRRIEISAAGMTPLAADCDCEDDSVFLDGLPAAAERTPTSTSQGTSTTPIDAVTGRVIDIVAPGDGPAVQDIDCDCIELPGGSDAREPSSDERPEDERAPEDEPFEPEGEFSDPGAENDEGRDEGLVSEEAVTAVEELPTSDVAEAVEDSSGLDVGTGPVERLDDGLSDLLDTDLPG